MGGASNHAQMELSGHPSPGSQSPKYPALYKQLCETKDWGIFFEQHFRFHPLINYLKIEGKGETSTATTPKRFA